MTPSTRHSATWNSWVLCLLRFGGRPMEPAAEVGVPDAGMIDILGSVEIVFAKGPYVAGVHEAPDAGRALRLAERLVKGLGAVHDRKE